MKKSVFYVLLLILILALTSCKNSTPFTHKENMGDVEAPELKIISNTDNITPHYYEHCWHWPINDHNGEHIAGSLSKYPDIPHPLQLKNNIPVVNSQTSEITLKFNRVPDTISVICWSDKEWDNVNAEYEDIACKDNVLQLKQGGYIYQVTGNWNDKSDKRGYGYYSYLFYANID